MRVSQDTIIMPKTYLKSIAKLNLYVKKLLILLNNVTNIEYGRIHRKH